MTIQLSVIVIEYNCLDQLVRFFSMLAKVCTGLTYEVIVTSNSCYPEAKQRKLVMEFPVVRWLFNPKNGGFAYGMNQGLQVSHGDFLLVCNPDIVIMNQLSSAVHYLQQNTKIGALGPRIEDEDGNLQDSCRRFMWIPEFLIRQKNRYFHGQNCQPYSDFDYTSAQRVDWVIGAFIMMRREVYELVHGFDEHYALYVEDMDLHYRIRRAGYETHYFPAIRCIYKGTRTSAKFILGGFNRDYNYSLIHLNNYLRFLGKVLRMKISDAFSFLHG